MNRYRFINAYVDKYPKKNAVVHDDSLFFWPLRDINALKRNRTFVRNYTSNAIVINKNKLDYYIYVDVFKRNLWRIPYYFGNCDVMIKDNEYQRYKDAFLADAIKHHPYLKRHLPHAAPCSDATNNAIDAYFSALLKDRDDMTSIIKRLLDSR